MGAHKGRRPTSIMEVVLLSQLVASCLILAHQHLGRTDAVKCYNCVSWATPACGAVVDTSKLRRSVQRGNSFSTKTTSVQAVTPGTRNVENGLRNRNSALAKTLSTLWTSTDSRSDNDSLHIRSTLSRHSWENTTSMYDPAVEFEIYNNTNNASTKNGVADGVQNTNKSVDEDIVIECLGPTCLVQIIHTDTEEIYVRTCDVSSVKVGSCNTVSHVLGARLSVVCTCSGDLCNSAAVRANSHPLLTWNLASFLTISITLTVDRLN